MHPIIFWKVVCLPHICDAGWRHLEQWSMPSHTLLTSHYLLSILTLPRIACMLIPLGENNVELLWQSLNTFVSSSCIISINNKPSPDFNNDDQSHGAHFTSPRWGNSRQLEGWWQVSFHVAMGAIGMYEAINSDFWFSPPRRILNGKIYMRRRTWLPSLLFATLYLACLSTLAEKSLSSCSPALVISDEMARDLKSSLEAEVDIIFPKNISRGENEFLDIIRREGLVQTAFFM